MYTLIHIAALAITIFALARLLPDVRIKNASTALVVAVTFSVLNFFLGWFVRLMLVLPTILTLGLLLLILPFVVNTILLWLTDKLLSSFKIESTGSLLMSAGAITVVNALLRFGLRYHAVAHTVHGAGPTRWI
jgi:putative membrane protein